MEPLLNTRISNRDDSSPTMITSRQLDPEDAETNNIARLDSISRQSLLSTGDEQYERMHDLLVADDPAVVAIHATPATAATDNKNSPRYRFANAARRVALLQKITSSRNNSALNKRTTQSSSPSSRHRRTASSAATDLLGQINASSSSRRDGFGEDGDRHNNNMVYQAAGIEMEFSESETDEEENEWEEEPVLPVTTTSYGSVATEIQETRRYKKFASSAWRRCCQKIANCNPFHLAGRLLQIFVNSFFVKIAVPCFAIAWFLYYYLGNPDFDFMPNQTRISWWFNFIGRQVITLELARFSQWLVLDCFLLGTRLSARWLGPLVTMTALQSRGWPFIMVAWATWDLVLLHGDNDFQTHWLYWTNLDIYSIANSGSYILSSPGYLRILLAMIVAGIATTIKRMFVIVRFGRRTLADFKPRLERLLADMVLLSEIADLAVEAEFLSDSFTDIEDVRAKTILAGAMPKGRKPGKLGWHRPAVTFERNASDGSERSATGAGEDVVEEEKRSERPSTGVMREGQEERKSPTEYVVLSDLDRWEEPMSKVEKSDAATMQDVVKFKHALNYVIDDVSPFGDSFGIASDRNSAIASSHSIYWKLLKYAPEPDAKVLDFDILALIAIDENGVEDEAKMKALRRLFQPDAHNELSLLAFVQSCDTVYKRLRYFKASLSNASVIDNALERILNSVYWFVLILLLLTIMQFDPYPLLVSITSLLVSVSFALGSSVSKYLEGVLLIAVRRPFDLGDRILISGVESADSSGAPSSWFVEDISLFSTTLRYGQSNEVSTVNNYSISQSRIVNLQRSTTAIVFFDMKLSLKILEGDKLDRFREALEIYVQNRPRIWDSMACCRHDLFDADMEFIVFRFIFRHRQSWQYAARINLNRADLLRFIFELSIKLDIQYEMATPSRRIIVEQGPDRKVGVPQDVQQTGIDPFSLIGTGPLD